MRDLNVNMNGERPSWMRDHQRPMGFNGYQDLNRYTPNVPATLRADTKPFTPAADQADNPNPANEVKVRGRHRANSRRPHVEKVVDLWGPSGASNAAAPSIGEQTGQATKRSNLESTFVIPGPTRAAGRAPRAPHRLDPAQGRGGPGDRAAYHQPAHRCRCRRGRPGRERGDPPAARRNGNKVDGQPPRWEPGTQSGRRCRAGRCRLRVRRPCQARRHGGANITHTTVENRSEAAGGPDGGRSTSARR